MIKGAPAAKKKKKARSPKKSSKRASRAVRAYVRIIRGDEVSLCDCCRSKETISHSHTLLQPPIHIDSLSIATS